MNINKGEATGIRYHVARWMFQHRTMATAIILILTAFFAAGLPKVKVQTIFSDLLPTGHQYAEVFRDHPNFGNPLTMTVMIKNRDGSIYNEETLQKTWDMTRDIDLAPAVNHDQVLSIASPKVRYAAATPYGINMRPVMGNEVPSSPEEIDDFASRVERSPVARNYFVSEDGTAALVQASFIEHRLDFGETFDFVQNLVVEARDDKHEVYLAGEPALIGWVYRHQDQMMWIFGITIGALFIALALYMRNLAGVVTPALTGLVSAIWGFGFAGWLGLAVEPLLLLVPLLLVARAFSHTVQYTERFYEVLKSVKDKTRAGELALRVMMGPGVLGIVTDALAILLIMLAPVPAMQRFAAFSGFWAMILIPTSALLAPLILSYMPTPRNLDRIVGGPDNEGGGGLHRLMAGVLAKLADATTGRAKWITGAVMLVFGAVTAYYGAHVKYGNPVEGSSLLWHDSEFNESVRAINSNFPGVNTLEIVLESKETAGRERTASKADTVHTMIALQDHMARAESGAPRASASFADYLEESARLYNGGDPRWLPLDPTNRSTQAAASVAMMGSSPENFSHVMDTKQQNATVSFWYKDNKQETVDSALAAARAAVEAVGVDHENFTVRLGSGTIALQQSVNETVAANYWEIVIFLNLLMFALAAIGFKSIVAGLMLIVPVNMSNFAIVASLSAANIGLDINTLLVAAVGVGVGIDYGVYLLARMCDEYENLDGDITAIIREAVTTTGRAIAFTATIMLVGILPWWFLSDLKFVAEMGLLLSGIMVINMIMALIILPLLVAFFKPRFLSRDDLPVSEHVDLRAYAYA